MVYIRVIDLFLYFSCPTKFSHSGIATSSAIENFAIRGVSILAVYIYSPCQEHAPKTRATAPIGVAGFL